jgi:hypothetical protein
MQHLFSKKSRDTSQWVLGVVVASGPLSVLAGWRALAEMVASSDGALDGVTSESL